VGLTIFHEDMTGARWAGFVLVWLALVIFTLDAVNNRRKLVRHATEAAPI
jgi:chloramphenicol-sensitive protein RarD